MNHQQYNTWTARLRGNERAVRDLVRANKVFTAIGYVAFPLLLALQLAFGQWPAALRTVLVAGIAFVALSAFRYLVNAPRPYEVLDIDPFIKKDTRGKSFPSRHTFSMYMIAFCWMAWCVPVGVVLTVTGMEVAATRVLGGVHWPRDVVAAFVFAAAAALVGFVLVP